MLPLCYNRPSDFYPRSPCGERLVAVCYDYYSIGFLSTLSLRRATETVFALLYEPDISIHALLAESDQRLPHLDIRAPNFYPRSPCGERHTRGQGAPLGVPYFYPRSPCGERRQLLAYGENLTNFYPRSPCGERQRRYRRRCRNTGISIHALLAESDAFYNRFKPCARYFYPRSPCGERLKLPPPPPLLLPISIHALLAESDVRCRVGSVRPSNFYPRSPCGERLFLSVSSASAWQFLSTLSLRRATTNKELKT